MTADNVVRFLSRKTSEAGAKAIAERVAPEDRLSAAEVALGRIDDYADGRRAMLRYSIHLIDLHLGSLGGSAIAPPLLHDAEECPPDSRILRAREVLRTFSYRTEMQPQAPAIALTYVRRLLELEADGGGRPPS
jgi:hypothetical protein